MCSVNAISFPPVFSLKWKDPETNPINRGNLNPINGGLTDVKPIHQTLAPIIPISCNYHENKEELGSFNTEGKSNCE